MPEQVGLLRDVVDKHVQAMAHAGLETSVSTSALWPASSPGARCHVSVDHSSVEPAAVPIPR